MIGGITRALSNYGQIQLIKLSKPSFTKLRLHKIIKPAQYIAENILNYSSV